MVAVYCISEKYNEPDLDVSKVHILLHAQGGDAKTKKKNPHVLLKCSLQHVARSIPVDKNVHEYFLLYRPKMYAVQQRTSLPIFRLQSVRIHPQRPNFSSTFIKYDLPVES